MAISSNTNITNLVKLDTNKRWQ